jgi:mycofactocin precursor peptide peptidase
VFRSVRLVLDDLTWPEVARIVDGDAVLAVPLGATEQHGPHLPLSTDTDLAVVLCRRLAEIRAGVLVAPAVPYGSSGEHAGFPGTLSIGSAALETVLIELCRSATATFEHVLIVSAHGGNAEPVRNAASLLRAEGRDVHVHLPRWVGDAHAGRAETSLQLAIDPRRVRMDVAARGDTRGLAELMPQLRSEGVRAVSPSGVLGDPSGANASDGRAMVEMLVEQLLVDVEEWRTVCAS